MAEVLLEYETVLRGRDGKRYRARACGRERADGTWEGWLEFVPEDGGAPLVSTRETTQPNRADLVYWATGLTDPYLDGALLRRLQTQYEPHVAGPAVAAAPGPAPHPGERPAPAHSAASPAAVLDPFHVYAEGADILRRQLQALSADQLRNIVRAYGLSTASPAELDDMKQPALVALIVAAVERLT